MKKSLQLKENKHPNKIKATQYAHHIPKDLKVYLPPIKLQQDHQVQKTLSYLVKKMQSFVSNYPSQISNIITRCLTALYEYLPSQNLSSSQFMSLNREYSKESLKKQKSPEQYWGAKSQVLSVKRTDLKKVESRKLFDKMRQAKYDEIVLKNDKDIINSLKRKIAEKDQGYCNMNKKIEDLKQQKQQEQKLLSNYQQKVTLLEQTNKSLSNVNQDLSSKIKQLQHQMLRNKAKEQFKIKSVSDKNNQLLVALRQRELQITSLWQTYLSNDKFCLL